MNRVELGAQVAEASGLTLKQANAAVGAAFEAVAAARAAGEEVTIHGFGSFRPKERSARTVVHPVTKERLLTHPSRSATFTPAANLRRKLDTKAPTRGKGEA
ncbi:MAG: HU family DNA-binding protein [Chloroflexota bacterium]